MTTEQLLTRVVGNKRVVKVLRYVFLPVLRMSTWIPLKSFRLMSVPTLADINYRRKRHLLSEKSARKLLAMAETAQADFLKENAMHAAYAVIGLHQLARNDLDGAGKSLIECANTPGSPQLSSFGPTFLSFDLANRLLEKGQRDIVLKFLRKVLLFWQMDHHQKRVMEWMDAILDGQTPELGRQK